FYTSGAAGPPPRGEAAGREPNPAELPLRFGRKEVAVARPDVTGRRRARAAAQDELVAHELAVVLADRTGERPVAGIRQVGGLRPFPDVAVHLHRLDADGVLLRQRVE